MVGLHYYPLSNCKELVNGSNNWEIVQFEVASSEILYKKKK